MRDNPNKREKKGCLMLLGSLILLSIIASLIGFVSSLEQKPLSPEEKAQEEKKLLEQKQEKTNEWYETTSQYSCESNLKEKLREPNSYERSGDFTITTDDGNNKIITWKFRAKNGFGGNNLAIGMCYVGKDDGGTIKTETIE